MKKFLLLSCLAFAFIMSNAQWNVLPNGTFSTTASPFGFGIGDIVFDKLGNVYVAGEFRDDGGNLYVAKWDGNSWTELAGDNMPTFGGCGLPVVCNLAIDTANNVYNSANGGVVKWDGSNWTSIGGNFTSPITGIVADNFGNLYVRSFSLDANGNPFISKWDGTKWSVLGNIPTTTKFSGTCFINHLATDLAGNLYADGYMTDSKGNRYIAKWDGTKWSELGDISSIIPSSSAGVNGWLASLCTDALGNVYASGNTTAINSSNSTANYKGCVAKWDGNSWSALGGADDTTFNTAFNAGSLVTDAASNLYCYAYQQYDTVSTNNIVKWDGSKWNVLGGSSRRIFNNGNSINGMNVDAAGNIYASSDIGTTGKVYFIAELPVSSTLPIKLLSFNAKESGNNVLLNWLATNETGTGYYILQRSTDGKTFTGIDKQNVSSQSNYSFIDKGLLTQNSNYYYRLEIVDAAGEKQYSNIATVQFTGKSNQLAVYPNPARDLVTLSGTHIASVQVIDYIGRLVKVVSLNDATNPTLYVSGLPVGVYHLRVQNTDGSVSGTSLIVNDK